MMHRLLPRRRIVGHFVQGADPETPPGSKLYAVCGKKLTTRSRFGDDVPDPVVVCTRCATALQQHARSLGAEVERMEQGLIALLEPADGEEAR